MSDFDRMAPKQVIDVRPLTKGMFRDRSSQHIEDGGFWTVRNGIVGPGGIVRRPAFYTIAGGAEFVGQANSLITYTRTTGNAVEMLVTSAGVYKVSKLTGLTLVPYPFTDGAATTTDGITISKASGTADWATTTDWDSVWPGDYFVLDSDGTAVEIDTVGETSLTLVSEYPVASFTEQAYTILRGFRTARERELIDTVVANDRVVFLSRFSPPVELDETESALETLQSASGDSVVNDKLFSAKCGAFFNERLFLGHITEWVDGAYEEYRQRIRFSTVTDFGDFAAASNSNYVDLDYTRGAINAILPMGNLLAVYLEDVIYLGQGTANVSIPLVFERVETGGVGLVGSKAIVPYKDGHFFVGQDNIYFHSTRGMEPIGTVVLSETVRKCERKWRIFAANDPKRNRVCFGFPNVNDFIEQVWSFEYQTGAWSYEDYSTWMIDSTLFDDSLTWADLSGEWADLLDIGPTWSDLRLEADTEIELGREFDGVLQLASRGAVEDDGAGPVVLQLESKDHDLGFADVEKCWTRLALKLRFDNNVAFDEALDFECHVSHNRGRTWKDVGRLRIRGGMDEGHCDFRLTSSHFRFRLTATNGQSVYTITEYTYSVTPFAYESHLGSQEA